MVLCVFLPDSRKILHFWHCAWGVKTLVATVIGIVADDVAALVFLKIKKKEKVCTPESACFLGFTTMAGAH